MTNYVKFRRGYADVFATIEKDSDTLYFIYENDDQTEASLYLGDKIIAGGGNINNIKLDDLADVLISEGLADSDFLVYDSVKKEWINKPIEDLLFKPASSEESGLGGLVPAPIAGQQDYVLHGDGTWRPVGDPIAIFQTELQERSYKDAIEDVVGDTELNKGDIVIIENNQSYISFIYDGTDWVNLNNEYNASNIYLTEGTSVENYLGNLFTDDSHIIKTDSGNISLKGWGKEYYRFVAGAEGTEGGYELQQVDNEHPWKSDLEPRVTSTETGDLILAWFEPNTQTIEGLNDQVAALDGDVTSLKGQMSAAGDRIDATESAITDLQTGATALQSGLAQAQTDIADRYTKTETNTKISEAITNADHLKRQIVSSIDEVVADNIIYMVPTGLTAEDDKYDEYMLIDGAVEKLGSWEVDLSQYAKTVDVTSALGNKVDKEDNKTLISLAELSKLEGIQEGAQKNYILSVSDNLNVDNSGKLSIVSIPNTVDLSGNQTIGELNAAIAGKVSMETGKSLVDDNLITKLQNMNADGEKNFISSVSNEFTVTEGALSFNALNNSIISGINTQVTTNKNAIEELNATLSSINGNITDLTNDIGELKDAMSWHDLIQ